jgi:hypothetical protein
METLKPGIYEISSESSGKSFYFRRLVNIVECWFRNPLFCREFVGLPLRYLDTSLPKSTSYHFVADFHQPCWRNKDGAILWVGEIVWSVKFQCLVRIHGFVQMADEMGVGDRIAECVVLAVVRMREFVRPDDAPDVIRADAGGGDY